MSEYLTNEKAVRLKEVIDRLASGARPKDVRREFRELIKGADATEVASLEQSLIEGGVPVEEVQRLCEVHADIFREGLERGEKPDRMPGHPVNTYLAENKEARKRLRALKLAAMRGIEPTKKAAIELKGILLHYARKENQLFPFLEKRGFTGPSKVMWGKHDEIREAFKALEASFALGDPRASKKAARELSRRLRSMIFMEEKILFPNALKRLTETDWVAVRRGEDAIGFAWIRPGATWDPALATQAAAATRPSERRGPTNNGPAIIGGAIGASTEIPLATGSLPLDWLDRVLKALPFDISFVDADDKVRYYSDSPHRLFPRSPGIIGREVQNCHPPKSVAVVERILEAFKKKEKDKADFWLDMNGRFILISYKAIYAEDGAYLGTLEMSMDATDIRALEGQRRLLDW